MGVEANNFKYMHVYKIVLNMKFKEIYGEKKDKYL